MRDGNPLQRIAALSSGFLILYTENQLPCFFSARFSTVSSAAFCS